MLLFSRILLIFLLVALVTAQNKKKGKGKKKGKQPKIKDPCLSQVEPKAKKFDDSKYGKGGPVKTGSELACNADKPCCWRNSEKGEVKGVKGNFIQMKGDVAKCQIKPKTKDNFIGFFSKKGFKGKVALISCAIICATDIVVTVPNDASKGIKLEACTKTAFDKKAQPKNCKKLPDGKPVRLKGGKIIEVVLVASGFKKGKVQSVAFDDIKVEVEKCPEDDICFKAQCLSDADGGSGGKGKGKGKGGAFSSSEGSICKWKNSAGRTFKVHSKEQIVGNSDTGVNANLILNKKNYPDVAKGTFAAVASNPGDTAILAIEELTVLEQAKMSMEVYEACDQNAIEVCADGKCKAVTNKGVKIADRAWKKVTVPIKKGTKKIEIKAVNSGDFYCSAGIADIDFDRCIEP